MDFKERAQSVKQQEREVNTEKGDESEGVM